MEAKTDIKIFFSYYKVAIFLGLTPSRAKKNGRPKKNLYRLFLAVLMLSFITWSFLFIQERIRIYDKISSPPFLIVDIAQNIIEIFFVCSCIALTELRGDIWLHSLDLLKTIESECASKDMKISGNEESIFVCIFKNTIGIALFLSIHLLEISLISKSLNPNYYILNFKMSLFLNEVFMVGFIQNSMKILRSRYEMLDEVLERVLKDEECVRKGLEDNLMELGKIYKKLYVLTQNFNNLFGWPMFYLLFTTAFAVLNCLNGLFLYDSKLTDIWKVVILNLAFACLYLVSKIYLDQFGIFGVTNAIMFFYSHILNH